MTKRMTYDEYKVFEKALETYGFDQQTKMLLEEMSELQKEICKYWRGRQNLREIAEEMADVQIMLDQMTLLFQNGGLQAQFRLEKVDRLRERLGMEDPNKETPLKICRNFTPDNRCHVDRNCDGRGILLTCYEP